MKNGLQIFNNAEFGEIRTLTKENEVWFVGKDVVLALGYSDLTHAVLDHVDEEDRINSKTQGQNDPEFGQRGTWLINESGLYSLILSSKLPSAKKFKRWVTSEVLPTIRKTGTYTINTDEIEYRKKNAEADLLNAKTKQSELWLRLADRIQNEEYKKICESYAANTLADGKVLPLPEIKEKTYSATEIGEILGVSANKIGAIAKKHNLKTEKYGKWFLDKSRYSNKEVETFRYYKAAIEVFRTLIGGAVA